MFRAVCTVGPNGKACDGSSGDTGVSGEVRFEQEGDGACNISYRVTGLTEGKLGVKMFWKLIINSVMLIRSAWLPHSRVC